MSSVEVLLAGLLVMGGMIGYALDSLRQDVRWILRHLDERAKPEGEK